MYSNAIKLVNLSLICQPVAPAPGIETYHILNTGAAFSLCGLSACNMALTSSSVAEKKVFNAFKMTSLPGTIA